jgi:hypothetical protein
MRGQPTIQALDVAAFRIKNGQFQFGGLSFQACRRSLFAPEFERQAPPLQEVLFGAGNELAGGGHAVRASHHWSWGGRKLPAWRCACVFHWSGCWGGQQLVMGVVFGGEARIDLGSGRARRL